MKTRYFHKDKKQLAERVKFAKNGSKKAPKRQCEKWQMTMLFWVSAVNVISNESTSPLESIIYVSDMLILADNQSVNLSGPEVSQPDRGITLYTITILLLSLTLNMGTKVSRYDLCILSGSGTRLSGNRITPNTTQHPHVFMLLSLLETDQNTCLFILQRRVKQY